MLKGTALLMIETIENGYSNGNLLTSSKPFAELSITHLTEDDIVRVLKHRTDLNVE